MHQNFAVRDEGVAVESVAVVDVLADWQAGHVRVPCAGEAVQPHDSRDRHRPVIAESGYDLHGGVRARARRISSAAYAAGSDAGGGVTQTLLPTATPA